MRAVKKGATDQSVIVRVVDSTDGTPETGVAYNTAGVDLWYRREGGLKVAITEATLAAANSAHSDGGFIHIGDGYCRLDLPDAAFATGSNGVCVGGTFTGMVVIGCYVPLVDFDPQDAMRLGLTALPNAAADAAGGIPISDAGGLDLDAKLAATNEVTAARMSELDPGTPGKMAAEVDLVKTDAAAILVDTGTDGVVVAAASKTGYALSAAGVQAIWDALTSALTAAGSIGKKLADWVVGTIDTYTGNTKQTGDVGVAGAGLTAVPWNAAWDVEVESEANDALVAHNLDHVAGTATAIPAIPAGTYLDQMMDDGTALFDRATDSLQAIRDTAPLGTAMRGTDNAALASVCTEARLAELDAANLPTDVAAVKTDTGNLVTRITATLFTGITSLAQWLGLMAGKQVGNSVARTEVRATGAGSGTFDETTDSEEAIRDRGDAAWGSGAITIPVIIGGWARSGSTYYVTYALVVNGALVTTGLSVLAVTFYDEDGTDLVFSGTPAAGATGLIAASGTLTTAVTDNRPVLVKVTATYNSVAYSTILPGASIAA